MTVGEVFRWIDRFAPFATQESFDNAGLLMGDSRAKVEKIFFALDATLPVVQDAVSWGAELLVTHHPLMFGGIRHIRYDQPEGAVLAALAGARLNLIAAHTNLDQADGGIGDSLAGALGLQEIGPVADSVYLRTGILPDAQSAAAFLCELDLRLGSRARLYEAGERLIRRVVVGPGAIGSEYDKAARSGADAFVVGEIKHHELIAAQALGLSVYEVGHFATEQPGMEALYRRFLTEASAEQWPVEARLVSFAPYPCVVCSANDAV